MSFSSSTQRPSANQVPAWKRLGLKLKSAASQPATGSPAQATSSAPDATTKRQDPDFSKRKRPNDGEPLAVKPSSLKKPRREDPDLSFSGEAAYQKRKSVSFAQVPKTNERPAAKANTNGKTVPKNKNNNKKKKKKPATNKSQEERKPLVTTEDTLQYLRRWKTSRDAWKFSKNHQSHLIKNAFDPILLPATDIDAFYDYIRQLQGFARKRLRETAEEIRKEDKFPEGTKDVVSKEEEYKGIMSGSLRPGQGGSKRKYYSEMEFTTAQRDGTITSRVIKRMRAEIVIDELMESEAAPDPSQGSTSATGPVAIDADGAKRVTINDGTSRPAKRIRASKKRTVDADSSSSSESSDSDGEESGSTSTSSSSEDSEDDSDDEMDLNAGPENLETSSSSSSSSDEESGSGEDSDDEEDDDEV